MKVQSTPTSWYIKKSNQPFIKCNPPKSHSTYQEGYVLGLIVGTKKLTYVREDGLIKREDKTL